MSHTSRQQAARANQKRGTNKALPQRALLDIADEARERGIKAGNRVVDALASLEFETSKLAGGEAALQPHLAALEAAIAAEGEAIEEALRALYAIVDCVDRWA